MKPAFQLTNRFRSYEPHIAKPTPRKPPTTPTIDAINRHELPVVKGGQGRPDYTPVPDWNWPKFRRGLMWAGACVLLGLSCVWAGQVAIQMMRAVH